MVRGQHWYLYLILDIYSRKIVAWEVHETESGELARPLVERALLRERCWHNPPVLHSDNGAPMTSYTLKARLAELGIPMSYSRPRVSNDNPYSESLFRTVKYCPKWPAQGFTSLQAVREWMLVSSMPMEYKQSAGECRRPPICYRDLRNWTRSPRSAAVSPSAKNWS